jgi:hypothetical protein
MLSSPPLSRTRIRFVHLLLGGFTFVVVYSPVFDAETSRLILRVAVFPGLAMSGIVLWKLAAVRRWLAGRRPRLVP